MKRLLKIVGFILLALAFISVSLYLYLTDFGRKDILSNEPRRPKVEVPITYNIGWWAYQDDLTVDSLRVSIVESNLSLFNSKSLISLTVSGQIKYEGHWKPEVKQVHISERINNDTSQHFDRIIEITPVVEVKDDEKANSGIEMFQFTNEHIITSNHWGHNNIKFICGKKEEVIELWQAK